MKVLPCEHNILEKVIKRAFLFEQIIENRIQARIEAAVSLDEIKIILVKEGGLINEGSGVRYKAGDLLNAIDSLVDIKKSGVIESEIKAEAKKITQTAGLRTKVLELLG